VFVLFEKASLRYTTALQQCNNAISSSSSSSSAKKAPSTSFTELQFSYSAPYLFFVFVLFEEALLRYATALQQHNATL
jgi:hypothetical protein